MESRPEPSPELRAAQERLLQLRATLGVAPQRAAAPALADLPEQGVGEALRWAQQTLLQRRQATAIPRLPAPKAAAISWSADPAPQLEENAARPSVLVPTITVHPTVLQTVLKQQLEAPARIYFLLRHLDTQGQGWLAVATAREQLTRKAARLRVCGWRRLRQLLGRGEGLFWRRDRQGRLWLTGLPKLAAKLGVARVTGLPVEIPLNALLGGIQRVRAHFYATFHSGRNDTPITRAKLVEMTGVPERTQRAYDRCAGVERQRNLAIGPRYTPETAEEQGWRRGKGAFVFIDTQGQQGAPRRRYVAWHLPNSYAGPHARRSKACRKRLNRQLADLLHKGTTGNDEQRVERVFWRQGAAVWQRRQPHGLDAYWPQGEPLLRRAQLWHVRMGERG